MKSYSDNNDEKKTNHTSNVVEFKGDNNNRSSINITNNNKHTTTNDNIVEFKAKDNRQTTKNTDNIVEFRSIGSKKTTNSTNNIVEFKTKDNRQITKNTDNIVEFKNTIKQTNNIVEIKGNDNKKTTNNLGKIVKSKSNHDKQTASSVSKIFETKSNDNKQTTNTTGKIFESKNNHDKQTASSVSKIFETNSDDNKQTTNTTDKIFESKSNNNEKTITSIGNIVESKNNDDKPKTNSAGNIVEPKNNDSKQTNNSTGNIIELKSTDYEQATPPTDNTANNNEQTNNSTTNNNNNTVNDVLDTSAGTNRHIRKRYSFSIDKEEDNIPVAVYSKRREHKKPQNNTPKRKKKSKKFKIFVGIGSSIISILLAVCITLTVLLINGEKSILRGNDQVKIQPPANVTVDGEYIVYNGEKYLYNNKITTILFSGIDTHTTDRVEGQLGTAGQADSLFVMALDTESGKYKLMSVSRDTMVDVNICDVNGNFSSTKKMQICLAHAYGDGKEISNENLKASVSRLFFGIPVNAYITIDLDVIPVLNDAVGGVNVNVIEDLSSYDPLLKKGANVTLVGNQAEIYVRSRDVEGDANQNNLRMERQISYITSFIQQSIQITKKDLKTPINLFNQITPYTRTDITPSEITYLSSMFMKNGFSPEENYLQVPGEAVAGEEYAEYYTNTDEFFKIILDTYYTKVQ
ncbi:MAG: LCP family protein [Acutalibacteraceae bacterium]|nr:LCP family protein [Acutalibacteraceae bacterium]